MNLHYCIKPDFWSSSIFDLDSLISVAAKLCVVFWEIGWKKKGGEKISNVSNSGACLVKSTSFLVHKELSDGKTLVFYIENPCGFKDILVGVKTKLLKKRQTYFPA